MNEWARTKCRKLLKVPAYCLPCQNSMQIYEIWFKYYIGICNKDAKYFLYL